jgi:hypothetical protein
VDEERLYAREQPVTAETSVEMEDVRDARAIKTGRYPSERDGLMS